MTIRQRDLYWLAGILEGEGCFTVNRVSGRVYPRIQVVSTDTDVLERLVAIAGGKIYGPNKTRSELHRPTWAWTLHKSTGAEDLMRLVYPLMCERRRSQIESAFAELGLMV